MQKQHGEDEKTTKKVPKMVKDYSENGMRQVDTFNQHMVNVFG
jgi:hypothetical protein